MPRLRNRSSVVVVLGSVLALGLGAVGSVGAQTPETGVSHSRTMDSGASARAGKVRLTVTTEYNTQSTDVEPGDHVHFGAPLAPEGRKAKLQQQVDGKWKTISTTRAYRPNGYTKGFSDDLSLSCTPGKYTYRMVAPGKASQPAYKAVRSAARTITVHPVAVGVPGEVARITRSQGMPSPTSISADGRYVTYSTSSDPLCYRRKDGELDGRQGTYLYDFATGKTTFLMPEYGGEISADGSTFVVMTKRNLVDSDTKRSEDIYLIDRVTGQARRFPLNLAENQFTFAGVALSQDASKVYWTRGTQVSKRKYEYQPILIDAATGQSTFLPLEGNANGTMSRDGTKFLDYERYDKRSYVFVYDAVTKTRTDVVDFKGYPNGMEISGDGKTIINPVANSAGFVEIYDVETGRSSSFQTKDAFYQIYLVGQNIVWSTRGGVLYTADLETLTTRKVFESPIGINEFAVSDDASSVAIQATRVFQVYAGTLRDDDIFVWSAP